LTRVFFDPNRCNFFYPKEKKLKNWDFWGKFSRPEHHKTDSTQLGSKIFDPDSSLFNRDKLYQRCANALFLSISIKQQSNDGTKINSPESSDGFWSKILDLGQVSHLWFGFEFRKFLLKMSNFSIFFPSDQKNLFGSSQKVPGSKAGWPLIYCGLKVSLGWVGEHL